MKKMTKKSFFLKLTLWQLEQRFSRPFSAFQSQDKIQIEYIQVNMLIFPKKSKNNQYVSKCTKSGSLKLTFDFYLEGKRQL